MNIYDRHIDLGLFFVFSWSNIFLLFYFTKTGLKSVFRRNWVKPSLSSAAMNWLGYKILFNEGTCDIVNVWKRKRIVKKDDFRVFFVFDQSRIWKDEQEPLKDIKISFPFAYSWDTEFIQPPALSQVEQTCVFTCPAQTKDRT